jgi:hypothetical protein
MQRTPARLWIFKSIHCLTRQGEQAFVPGENQAALHILRVKNCGESIV